MEDMLLKQARALYKDRLHIALAAFIVIFSISAYLFYSPEIISLGIQPGTSLVEIAGFDFISQLTLATVLFYAGLTLNLRELRLSIVNVMLLATAATAAAAS